MIFGSFISLVFMSFSLPVCDEYLGKYYMSSYYHPVPGQLSYYGGSYASDKYVNCAGSCNITASGYELTPKDENKIVACPPNFPFKTLLMIQLPEGHPEGEKRIIAKCEDRGGSIKGRRLDLWIGKGEKGKHRPWIRYSTRNAKVFKCS